MRWCADLGICNASKVIKNCVIDYANIKRKAIEYFGTIDNLKEWDENFN